ncbi:unnamed protein product [Prorocentrum cordatum]|nr:unnamed protein product [Polarella glacialis]
MVQRNLQTGKSRAVRRAEFRYQSQVVEDGGSFVLEARLRGGQEVSWAWEVQGDRGDSLDFRADFAADSAAGSLLPWGAAETLARGSQSEHAWSYAARGAGRLRLCWSSPRSWSAAAPRVLLVECWRGAATEEVAGLPCAAEWLAAAGVAEPAGDGEAAEARGPAGAVGGAEEEEEGEEWQEGEAESFLRPFSALGMRDPTEGMGREAAEAAAAAGSAAATEPPYWSGRARACPEGWHPEHVGDETTLDALRRMLAVARPEELGKGYDVKRYSRTYRRLDISGPGPHRPCYSSPPWTPPFL